MALTTVVMVGESKAWLPDLVAKVKALKLGNGMDAGTDVSPLCYSDLKGRVMDLLNTHEKEGGKFLLDGRSYVDPTNP
jgi:malonate-semialdehyde dehydrogenase (acetylating)/methylmalonate-semialdehyde dehydrogenase